jgi:Fic family protein
MAFARSEHSSQRFYSMSAQIKQEHKEYYDILESTQQGAMDVTAWMLWFLDCLGRAIDGANVTRGPFKGSAREKNRVTQSHDRAMLDAMVRTAWISLVPRFFRIPRCWMAGA